MWLQLAADKGQRAEVGAQVYALCDKDASRATWVLVNDGSTTARVECSCVGSRDVRSSLPKEVSVVSVPANESVVALHMVAASETAKPRFQARFDHKHD